ncbi:MAG: hypothetical protein IPI01_11160 [Ignavibacteriae bacterium]|nr:hypothetical protein [Ignavibacteriota bacterium]
MTKVMFQIGLLAFFVSAVIFGTQGAPVMDAIARAFIVFIAVVAGQVVVLVVASGMKGKPTPVASVAEPTPRSDEGAAEDQEPPTTQASASAA